MVLFSFQYTASGPAANVGFLTSDLAVIVSETLGDGAITSKKSTPPLHFTVYIIFSHRHCLILWNTSFL